MHFNGSKIQHTNLGFIDKVGNVLTTAADVAQKGVKAAQTGKNIYADYKTVFSPQPTTPAGTPTIYTAAPYGGSPAATTTTTFLPPVAVPAAQTGASTLDSAGTLKLQKTLKALGYDPGPLDGIVGTMTENAIRAYQSARGLTPVDGRATRIILATAEADLAKQRNQQKQQSTEQMPGWLLPALGAGALFLFVGR